MPALKSMCDVLDFLSAAVVMIDADGNVLATNRAAQAKLGSILRVVNGRILATDPAIGAELCRLIETLTSGECTSPLHALEMKSSNGRSLFIYAIQLSNTALRMFEPARAILVLQDQQDSTLPSEERVSAAFGLTPNEARLAVRIAAGDRLASVAKAWEISYETARSVLKAVFHKTQTHRQAELALLVSRLAAAPAWMDEQVTPVDSNCRTARRDPHSTCGRTSCPSKRDKRALHIVSGLMHKRSPPKQCRKAGRRPRHP